MSSGVGVVEENISTIGPNVAIGRAHLGQHLVEPLQWAVEVYLHPAGRVRDGLPPVVHSPAFHEADANGAHSCQLVDCLKAIVD